MPWIEDTQPGLTSAGTQTGLEATSSPGLRTVWNALFESENTLGSVGRWAGNAWARAQFDDVEGYDPFDAIGGYEQYADRFVSSNSPGETEAIKRQIDRENRNRGTIADSGWAGTVLGVGVTVTDPVNLLPIGGVLAKGNTALRGLLIGGGVAGVSAVGQEAILQGTQETRTTEESLMSIGGATLFGGVLGSAVGAWAGSQTKAMADLETALYGEGRPYGGGGSLSAADGRDLSGNDLVGSFGADTLQTMPVVGSPLMRNMKSESPVVRDLTERLAELPLVQRKNMEGRATAMSAETGAKLWQFNLYDASRSVEDAFTRYRMGRKPGFGTATRLAAADMAGATGGKLKYREFSVEVGKALRRNDEHSIPEVAEAAKAVRAKFFEPQRKALVELEFLGEDHEVTTALSYYTRDYDTPRIIAERTAPGGFEERLVGGLLRKQVKASSLYDDTVKMLARHTADIEDLTAKLKVAVKAEVAGLKKRLAAATYRRDLTESKAEGWRFLARADESDLKDIARQITDKIVGNERGALTGIPDFLESNKRGVMAERVLTFVQDEEIEDYLISDVNQVLRRAVQSSAPDIEIGRQFGRPDMADAVDDINEDFARLREAVEKSDLPDAAKRKRLQELQQDQRDALDNLRDMRARIRGTYGIPTNPEALGWRALRVLKQVNHVTFMGSAAFPSSLPDIARSIFQHGVTRVFADGLVPLVRNFKQIRLSADEYRLGGAAMEVVLDTRLSAMSDLNQAYNPRTRFEQGMENLVRKFNILNIMAPWTDGLQIFEGMIAQKRMLDGVEKLATGKGLSAKDRRWLAESGIDEQMAARMWAERENWVVEGGLKQGNARAWADADAARTFMGAMGKAQRTAIIEPGQDKPLWMSGPIGSLVGQFRSFSMVSTSRIMALGLQRSDAAALSGVTSMIAFGMLSYYLQSAMRSDKSGYDLPDDVGVWVSEGITRSGVAGWVMDANSMIEKASSNNLGLAAVLGRPASSRYQSRNVTGSFLGPSFGRVEDIVKLLNAVSTGEWAPSDTKALRRQVPLQNLFYLRWLFDQAEGD